MAEEKTADQKKEEELSLAERAGDAVWRAVVWDDEVSFGQNVFWTALTVASLAAIPFTGGASSAGVAASLAGKTAARVALRVGEETLLKQAEKGAVREGVETAEKIAAKKAAEEAAAKAAAEKAAAEKVAKPGLWERLKAPLPPAAGIVYAKRAALISTGLATVGGVGLNWYENSHGHPVAKWLADRARKNIDLLIEAGTLDEKTLVNIIEGVASNLSFLKDFSSSVVGGMETGGFAIQLGDHPTPEEVQRVKGEALGFALKDPLLLLRAGLRARGAKHLFPDQNERDLYLTNKFVEDLVKGADNAAFSKENKVTENDVKVDLKRLMVRGGVEADILRKFPHLENGLRQKWPDLFDAPAPVVKDTPEGIAAPTTPTAPTTPEKAVVPPEASPVIETPKQPVVAATTTQPPQANTSSAPDLMKLDVSGLKGPDLSAAFDKATKDFEKRSPVVGWLMGVAKGISSLFNEFGMNDLADDFDRFVLRMAKGAVMVSQFSGRFNLDNLKSHVPELKKPEVVLAPAPAP